MHHGVVAGGLTFCFQPGKVDYLRPAMLFQWNRLKAISCVKLSNYCVVGPFVDLLYYSQASTAFSVEVLFVFVGQF